MHLLKFLLKHTAPPIKSCSSDGEFSPTSVCSWGISISQQLRLPESTFREKHQTLHFGTSVDFSSPETWHSCIGRVRISSVQKRHCAVLRISKINI